MCGIVGAIGRSSRAIVDAVSRMSASQVHRGPDGEGAWQTDGGRKCGVVFRHRRLSIIDLSDAASQPMVDLESGWVITYNGEVYNYREIRNDLETQGVSFSSECDTEVVLKALAKWGEEALERFRGMFAFAAWDPESRRVLLARDRLGIKPLYFTSRIDGARADGVDIHGVDERDTAVLLFSSELRSLLCSDLVSRRMDPRSLETYLWNGFVPGPGTILRDVEQLPPGCYAWVDPERPSVEPLRYWSYPMGPGRDEEAPANLGRNLSQAVEERLVSDVPLGIFLSGGIDSSAVAALAVKAAGDCRIRTFNIAFAEGDYDESHYASHVAKQLGTTHERIVLGAQDFLQGLPDAIESLDQPTFDAVNSYHVSRAVRMAGIKVALAGTGGDELFGGYTSFADIPLAQQWARRLRFLPVPLLQSMSSAVARWKSGGFGDVRPQTKWGKLGAVLATRGGTLDLYQLSYSLFVPDFLDELMNCEGSNEVRSGLLAGRYHELESCLGSKVRYEEVSRLECELFLGDRLLRDTDCTSMSVSLEVRLPLLDHRVVEAAAQVAGSTRYLPLQRKRLLIELGTPGLDASLFNRPKAGFEIPFELWLRGELRDEVAGWLSDRGACHSVGLNPEAVGALWSAFLEAAPGVYWSRIWAIYILLRWTKQHRVSL